MHGHAGRFADGVQPRHHGVVVVADLLHHFTVVVGRDAAHVVVHGRNDRDRLLVHVDAGEDAGALGDARQLLVDHARAEVGQVEQDVVLVLADAAAFADLDGHRTADHVARGQILVVRCIALHEALAAAVAQDAAFTADTLGDQAAGAVDAGRVELHELHVLHGDAGTHGQAATVAGAGVRRGGAEVGTAVAAGGQHHALGAEQVQRAIGHVQGQHAAAGAFVVEDQVEREVLDHEARIVLQRLLVQGVQHRVAGTVGRRAGTLRRRAFAVLGGHATERTLVDLAFGGARERHAVVFKFDDGRDGLTAHVLDGVLVTQPVRPLDGVEEVVAPVVLAHVAECGRNTALGGNGVRTGREDLGQAHGLQALGGQAERGAQAGTAGADHDHVVLVFGDLVSGHLIWIPV